MTLFHYIVLATILLTPQQGHISCNAAAKVGISWESTKKNGEKVTLNAQNISKSSIEAKKRAKESPSDGGGEAEFKRTLLSICLYLLS